MDYSIGISVSPVGNSTYPVVQASIFRYVDSVMNAHASLVNERLVMPVLHDEEQALTWMIACIRQLAAELESQLAVATSEPSGKLMLDWYTFKKSLWLPSGLHHPCRPEWTP